MQCIIIANPIIIVIKLLLSSFKIKYLLKMTDNARHVYLYNFFVQLYKQVEPKIAGKFIAWLFLLEQQQKLFRKRL